MAELRVAVEAAEKEFERLCTLRRIDIDEDGLTKKELTSLKKLRAKIVKEISVGTLVVGEDGTATYTPPVDGAKPLTFRMAKGATFMAMDDGKEQGEQHMMIAMLADLTGWPRGELSKLAAPDYTFCAALVGLFLG